MVYTPTPTPVQVLENYPELLKLKKQLSYLEYVKMFQQKTIELKEKWQDEDARGIKRYKSCKTDGEGLPSVCNTS